MNESVSCPDHVDVLVIGSGPGGYVAAIRASQLGKSVVVVDENEPGGVCLHSGCIPSKALISAAKTYELFLNSKHNHMGIVAQSVSVDFSQVQQWKEGIVQKLKNGVEALLSGNQVAYVKGRAQFKSEKDVQIDDGFRSKIVKFEHCIVASGSRPVELQGFAFGNRIVSSKEILQLKEIPSSLAVIGAGYIGVELGQTFAKFGAKVALLEYAPHILPTFESELASIVEKKMKKNGMQIITGASAKTAYETESGVTITYTQSGEDKKLDADYLVVAVGRKPNTDQLSLEDAGVQVDQKGFIEIDRQCRTSNQRIFAIGDIVRGPALAYKASYEGKVAAEAIAGHPSAIDYKAIPSVIFSDPEIAVVGLSEKEAREKNYKVKTGKFSYAANGRALSLLAGEGFVKVIAEANTGYLIGAQIVGIEASNLIAEISLAMEMGSTLEDIAATIHAHPSLGEIVMEASEAGMGKGVHSLS